MAKKFEVYKCNLCGNIVEVLYGRSGTLTCCGSAMIQLDENTVDAAKEKHVPVIKRLDGGVKVCVGQVNHPMQEEHFIEWIEIIAEGEKVSKQFLKPNQTPEASFSISDTSSPITVRAYCNLHGLWKA
jgi:superoxide reductase